VIYAKQHLNIKGMLSLSLTFLPALILSKNTNKVEEGGPTQMTYSLTSRTTIIPYGINELQQFS
jgi:hypothetical protein